MHFSSFSTNISKEVTQINSARLDYFVEYQNVTLVLPLLCSHTTGQTVKPCCVIYLHQKRNQLKGYGIGKCLLNDPTIVSPIRGVIKKIKTAYGAIPSGGGGCQVQRGAHPCYIFRGRRFFPHVRDL